MRRYIALLFVLLAACAAPKHIPPQQALPPAGAPAHPPRAVLIYIPQSDENAGAWLKWFAKYPDLRMVVAVSPRFQRFGREPLIKDAVQALIKGKRLELAL